MLMKAQTTEMQKVATENQTFLTWRIGHCKQFLAAIHFNRYHISKTLLDHIQFQLLPKQIKGLAEECKTKIHLQQKWVFLKRTHGDFCTLASQ